MPLAASSEECSLPSRSRSAFRCRTRPALRRSRTQPRTTSSGLITWRRGAALPIVSTSCWPAARTMCHSLHPDGEGARCGSSVTTTSAPPDGDSCSPDRGGPWLNSLMTGSSWSGDQQSGRLRRSCGRRRGVRLSICSCRSCLATSLETMCSKLPATYSASTPLSMAGCRRRGPVSSVLRVCRGWPPRSLLPPGMCILRGLRSGWCSGPCDA